MTRGQLIINCRAEAAPEALRDAVRRRGEQPRDRLPGLNLKLEHLEYFRPGKPTPTHRDTQLDPTP